MGFTEGLLFGYVLGAVFVSIIVLAVYRVVQIKRNDLFSGAHLIASRPKIVEGHDKTQEFIDKTFEVEKGYEDLDVDDGE